MLEVQSTSSSCRAAARCFTLVVTTPSGPELLPGRTCTMFPVSLSLQVQRRFHIHSMAFSAIRHHHTMQPEERFLEKFLKTNRKLNLAQRTGLLSKSALCQLFYFSNSQFVAAHCTCKARIPITCRQHSRQFTGTTATPKFVNRRCNTPLSGPPASAFSISVRES